MHKNSLLTMSLSMIFLSSTLIRNSYHKMKLKQNEKNHKLLKSTSNLLLKVKQKNFELILLIMIWLLQNAFLKWFNSRVRKNFIRVLQKIKFKIFIKRKISGPKYLLVK